MVLPVKYQDKSSFSFGDSSEMADSGLRDVIARKQVATCEAYEIASRNEGFLPHQGRLEIVLDGANRPGCAIKYWKVDTCRFDEVDEQFALDEACEDLNEWKTIHEAYFRRKGCFQPDMKIFRLYFDVVEVFEPYLDVSGR